MRIAKITLRVRGCYNSRPVVSAKTPNFFLLIDNDRQGFLILERDCLKQEKPFSTYKIIRCPKVLEGMREFQKTSQRRQF